MHCAERLARSDEGVLVGLLLSRTLALTTQFAEDQHDPEHGGKQDELLAESVEPAYVEVQRGDQIGRVALGHADSVDHVTVDAVVLAEGGQAREAVDEDYAKAGGPDREQHQPGGAAHPSFSRRSRSCSWTLRSASRIITGSPTVETTISDRATSGA